MKRYFRFFLYFFTLLPSLLLAQGEGQNDDYVNYKKQQEEKEDDFDELTFAERSYWGGNLSLSLGNMGTYTEVSPVFGYNLSWKFSVGVGSTFKYFSGINPYYGIAYNTYVWGGSIFGRYLIGKNFFAQAELESLNTDVWDDFNQEFTRKFITIGAAGLGFRSDMGYNSYSYLLVMYDFIGDRDSPYPLSPIIFKAGMIFPIKAID